MNAETNQTADRELVLSLILDAPREKIWRCWTEPELLKQCFAPAPWTTPHAELDVRPGGSNYIVMRGPEGQEFPNRGVYLEVVPCEKLVFTDAYTSAWSPSPDPFFTAVLTFEAHGDKTRYTARALHWSAEKCKQHAEMGFEPGWTQCARQVEALARTL